MPKFDTLYLDDNLDNNKGGIAMQASPERAATTHPLTPKDIEKHFGVCNRTVLRWAETRLPHYYVWRLKNFRGGLRFKREAIPHLEKSIRLHRGEL